MLHLRDYYHSQVRVLNLVSTVIVQLDQATMIRHSLTKSLLMRDSLIASTSVVLCWLLQYCDVLLTCHGATPQWG
jgi:hypothetical protein